MNAPASTPEQMQQLHQTYCQLTGQRLCLGYDRERLWFEFLRAGFGLVDLTRVVGYLQKEIRSGRRNVGALKLSNLLQLDRFEEDLNISRARLTAQPPAPTKAPPPICSPVEQQLGRQRALAHLRELKEKLRQGQL